MEVENDLEVKKNFYIEENTRLGYILFTVYKTGFPIGSFTLDPKQDIEIINDIRESVKRWEIGFNERLEKERIGRNIRQGKGNL